MACTSAALSGLTLDCENSKGGIQKVWIANFDQTIADAVAAVSVSADSVAFETISGATGTWHAYEFRRGTGSMTSTLNVDDANGVNYVSTDITLQFGRMEARKRAEMKALSLNETMVLVKDNNGKVWFCGFSTPVMASSGSGQTGQAVTDGNFYQIVLQANDDTYPIEVTGGTPA
jgi:hypothetical protein